VAPSSSGDDASASRADAAIDAPTAMDGGAPAGKVPIFIAQGMLGRTIVSCDDGNTWVGNHSWDRDGDPLMCRRVQEVTCGDPNCMYLINDTCTQHQCCDDTPDVPEGIAFGNDMLAGAWGHGQPGAIRSSTDGVTWTTQHVSNAFSMAFGGGRFVAAGNPGTAWSTDGISWTQGGMARFNTRGSPVRAFAYGDYGGGGRFVALSAGNGRDILVSSDGALTWWRPSVIPETCGLGVGGVGGDILSGNGILLIVD